MRKEHSRLLAEQAAKVVAAEKRSAALAREEAAPGIPLGFNPIRYVSPVCMSESPHGHIKFCADALYKAHT